MASKVPQDTPDSGIIIRAPIFPEDELLEREPKYAFPPIPISDPFFGGVPRTLMPGDIAAQAANVSKDFPSVWLIKSKDNDTNRRIECKTSEFHARLIQEVVSQFVQLDPTAIAAL
ncbi:unnamed protein product [Aspergillus oryzae RIB40]|uniref:DNA, SC005 n=2 Tax=Aspergillus oryzae TaxID=5062 RepID=Q2USK7_ASPOR|nr:unnamed protein product [Aspergillus oryzae RIB40]BAE55458.1 unnamed protein product [Aspergillus oryzae RIB40]